MLAWRVEELALGGEVPLELLPPREKVEVEFADAACEETGGEEEAWEVGVDVSGEDARGVKCGVSATSGGERERR